MRVLKALEWEFWPFWLFYVPVYLSWPYYWLKTSSPAFFTAVNPAMKHGGFVAYSKSAICENVPSDYLPRGRFFEGAVSETQVLEAMKDLDLSFPVVLKPDRGERGFNVEIIDRPTSLQRYLTVQSRDLILQEFVDFPDEYGIMYCRFPGRETGMITSIVVKRPMTVCGNGRTDLETLIRANPRCDRYRAMLERLWHDDLKWVPEAGRVVRLTSIGNHRRGIIFNRGNHLISDDLVRLFDRITASVEGFHLGRFDVKAPSFGELMKGRMKIIEINGVNSEPGHIYDPGNSLWSAYGDLLRHWNLIASVAKENMRRGVRPDKTVDVIASAWRHLLRKRRYEVSMG